MGILIDIVLVAILLLSTFLGYKKGLVKLGAKLFAGIIAIIVTIVIYKPVSDIIINNTPIEGKIENIILENTPNIINENSQINNSITEQIENKILPEQAKLIAKNIVYAITAIVLFIVVKIILSIIISLMDFVANLPILKQFNEVGGIIYGMVRGVLIVSACVLVMGIVTKMNPESTISNQIENSYLTKEIYKNIVKF